MAGALLTKNGDVQIGDDGAGGWRYLLSPGTTAWAVDFNPWTWPELHPQDTAQERHGVDLGNDAIGGREVEVEFVVKAATQAALRAVLHEIANAVKPAGYTVLLNKPSSLAELAFQAFDTKYFMRGRYRDFSVIDASRVQQKQVRCRLKFTAYHPWLYDCTESTYSITSGLNATRRARPIASPVSINISGSSQSVAIVGEEEPLWELEFVAGTTPAHVLNPTLIVAPPGVATTAANLVLAYGQKGTGTSPTSSSQGTWRIPPSTTGKLRSGDRDGMIGAGADSPRSAYQSLPTRWDILKPGTSSISVSINGATTGGPTTTTGVTCTLRVWPAYRSVKL